MTALLIVTPLIIISSDVNADDSDGGAVLFDMGNGDTTWSEISSVGTIDDVLHSAASNAGLQYGSLSNKITINDVTEKTIGSKSKGGSLSVPGTTGVTVTAKWIPYIWDSENGKWAIINNISAPYTGGTLALGFYPNGYVPVETPDNPSAWTMIRGNARQDGALTTATSESQAELVWKKSIESAGVQAAILSAHGNVFVKYNPETSKPVPPAKYPTGQIVCYSMDGTKQWEFAYPTMPIYDLSTPLIVGDFIFVPASSGLIFKIPLRGPGENNNDVTTFNNRPISSVDILTGNGVAIPQQTATLTGNHMYQSGPGSLIYDSGAIYFGSTNGMMYCFDLDLNLIWSAQMGGCSYVISQTVTDKYVFAGALNGTLYAIDKMNGVIIDQAIVYTTNAGYGSVLAVSVFEENGEYTLIFGVTDGTGLYPRYGGFGIYKFDGNKLSLKYKEVDDKTFSAVSSYVLPIDTNDFRGVYLASLFGIYKIDLDGKYELVNKELTQIRAPMVLVNDDSIYIQDYTINNGLPIYVMSLDGTIKSKFIPDPSTANLNYSQSPPLVIDGFVFSANDSGINVIYGAFRSYGGSENTNETPLIYILVIILLMIVVILTAVYLLIRFIKKEDKPFNYISKSVKHYIGGEDLRHNKRSKHRLWVVLAIGIILSVMVFFASLCIGYHATMSFGDMLHALFGAISNGGADPSNLDQIRVFESRLPRALAALGVGIGLSVAGSMYQAVIRNPLVDPYIMGVSSGAGTAAVAVIAFNFTFFGLFAANSVFTTAIVAMIGGLIAFAVTMFIAEKAGGTSINFVLAGVVVGLAFSSIQTLMMSMAGHEVSNALSWLFGSFANISWNQVWIILLPGLAMSLVPLIWAKELNLVLLGEDQAQQMGLNVRRFNRLILILASVLTSLCVAFVGIIGFVGLVIPHLCRMMLGGDHRLVLPASIAFGGALMMFADLASRTLYLGLELPVGAITTIIGVPVFAYLLIRRGKMYDG